MNETPCFRCENLGEGNQHIHCGSIHVLRKRERKNPYFTHLFKTLLVKPAWKLPTEMVIAGFLKCTAHSTE